MTPEEKRARAKRAVQLSGDIGALLGIASMALEYVRQPGNLAAFQAWVDRTYQDGEPPEDYMTLSPDLMEASDRDSWSCPAGCWASQRGAKRERSAGMASVHR